MGSGLFMALNMAFIAAVLYALDKSGNLNGFVGIGAVIQFWGGLYLFTKWRLYRSNVQTMSTSQLLDLQGEWVKGVGGFKSHSPGELTYVRRRSDSAKLITALQRVIEIHRELIGRGGGGDSVEKLADAIAAYQDELDREAI